jgi:hypothetical protein
MTSRPVVVEALAALAALGLFMTGCGPVAPEEDSLAVFQQATSGGDLGSRLGTAVVSSDTCRMTSDFQPTCITATDSASDLSYVWHAPIDDTFTFYTSGSGFNPVLEVRVYDNTAMSLGCNDNASSSTLESSVSVPLKTGQTVLVVVDGYGMACGTFRLGIRSTKCSTGCTTPPNRCYESPGICAQTGCQYTFACGVGQFCFNNSICCPSSLTPADEMAQPGDPSDRAELRCPGLAAAQ